MASFTHTNQLKGTARHIAEEGFAAGYASDASTFVNPYAATADAGGLAAELYADGFSKGQNKRYNEALIKKQEEWARQQREAAELRRQRVEARLLALFDGDQDVADEFMDMIKDMIRAEMAPRSDY